MNIYWISEVQLHYHYHAQFCQTVQVSWATKKTILFSISVCFTASAHAHFRFNCFIRQHEYSIWVLYWSVKSYACRAKKSGEREFKLSKRTQCCDDIFFLVCFMPPTYSACSFPACLPEFEMLIISLVPEIFWLSFFYLPLLSLLLTFVCLLHLYGFSCCSPNPLCAALSVSLLCHSRSNLYFTYTSESMKGKF